MKEKERVLRDVMKLARWAMEKAFALLTELGVDFELRANYQLPGELFWEIRMTLPKELDGKRFGYACSLILCVLHVVARLLNKLGFDAVVRGDKDFLRIDITPRDW